MERAAAAWPVKSRDVHTHHMDSTVWDDFKFRDDDIVIATYAKSGTTWMQQIVSQLIFGGVEDIDVYALSPWIDLRILPPEAIAGLAMQKHRRFVKTHLPADALVISPKAKYIYIGRDGRDAAWSMHNHHYQMTDELFARYNEGRPENLPLLVRGTSDPHEFYKAWFEKNGFPIWPYWENVRSWWAIRDLPNLLLVHFNDLKADLQGSLRRVAGFLDIEIDDKTLSSILHYCSFDYMRAHATRIAPRGGNAWKGGGTTFFNKGTNGRWRDILSAAEIAAYEAKAEAELGADCSVWLANGGPVN